MVRGEKIMNLLQTAIKLMQEVEAENTRQSMELHNLQDDYDLLDSQNDSLTSDYYTLKDTAKLSSMMNASICAEADHFHFELGIANKRLLSTSNAVESLTDDLCDASDTIGKLRNDSLSTAALQRKIAEQAIEIKKLGVYKRKAEVLAKDLADAKKQALRASRPASTGGFKSEGQKITQRKLNAANGVIADYAAHYLISPQSEGQFEHSDQGIIDLYRLNQVTMNVERNGGVVKELQVERMIMMNSYNSCKVITRINGAYELGKATIPKGGVIKLDDEMLDYALVRFKENDINKARLTGKKTKAA